MTLRFSVASFSAALTIALAEVSSTNSAELHFPRIQLFSLRRLRDAAIALFLVALCTVFPELAHATGLTITPSFDSTITSDPNAAAIENTINQAINTYETTFSDPINSNSELLKSSIWVFIMFCSSNKSSGRPSILVQLPSIFVYMESLIMYISIS